MENLHYIINKKLPKTAEPTLKKLDKEEKKVLFAVVGDMAIDSTFFESAAFFTKDEIIVFDRNERRTKYSDIKKITAKRMYGNAALTAEMNSGENIVLMRYTFAVADLCDAAALFINNLNGGGDFNEECAIFEAAFEKVMNTCPKCGRKLLHAGTKCLKCSSKKTTLSKFAGYIKPQTKRIIISLILAIFTTVMALVPPAITGFIVDNIFSGSQSSGFTPLASLASIVGDNTNAQLTVMILVLLLAYIFNYGVGIIRNYIMRVAGEYVATDIRDDTYEKAMYLKMSFYDKASTGSVINRISSDAIKIRDFMFRITQEAVVQFMTGIGIIILMLSINPSLTLLSLVPIPIIVFATRIFSKKIKPLYTKHWRRWTKVTSVLTDTIPCIKVIKSFSGAKRMTAGFIKADKDNLDTSLSTGKLTVPFPQIVSFMVTCGTLIIWGIGGRKVLNGDPGYSAGLIVSFISYAAMFYVPVNFFANLSDSFQDTMASAERILDILDAEPEDVNENTVVPDKFRGEIEFKNVNFGFDKSHKVLDNVSFKINPGEVVGIVGTTGSGKSTLINLLMRFYQDYTGEILIDGHNIKYFELESYRNCIGYVQQEPMMFSDTIYNNILFGRPDAATEEVFQAADTANAHGFIVNHPLGYNTMLGERGVGVSGGEKQRLSIARAVIKNPSIMIFDEATAAVDSETEKLIQDAIDNLIEGKTTIMIAHRLSTLKKATRIIVVDQGKIIENDTPEKLMEMKGKYYKLVQIQTMSQEAEKQRREENLDI